MALTKWQPPISRHELSEGQDRVTWLELFFDLVYVAALIQLGDQLSNDVTWTGVARFSGLFAVLWWTWTGTTAFTNRFAVDDIAHRVLVFIQMFAVANVALLAVGPNTDRWAWLAVAYVASRIPLLLMYARALSLGGEAEALARKLLAGFSAGAALWVVSIAVPEPARFVLWAVAMAIEFLAPFLVVRNVGSSAPTHEHHFRERYAIFTIIVFGETFVKTLTKLAEKGVSIETQLFGGLVFVAAAALWWTYFDDVADSKIRTSSPLIRVSWVYVHLPLAAALTAFGVGGKKLVDVDALGDAIYQPYLWLFAGAIAAALLATAVLDLLTISPHFAVSMRLRVGPRVVAAILVLLVAATINEPGLIALALIVAIVAGQIAVEVLIAGRADRELLVQVQSSIDQSADGCEHLAQAVPIEGSPHRSCSVCETHDMQWVGLRQCQTCGYIGCCDSSPARHARGHWEETGHPVMRSVEPGETWAYCFDDDATVPDL